MGWRKITGTRGMVANREENGKQKKKNLLHYDAIIIIIMGFVRRYVIR